MGEVAISVLKKIVEEMHGGTAKFVESVRVHEKQDGKTVWMGIVRVFDLEGSVNGANRVYAWAYDLENGERRSFAVLHLPPIEGPIDVVREAIVMERRMAKYGREPTR